MRCFFSFLALLLIGNIWGQTSDRYGLNSKLNFNIPLEASWKLNASLQSRHLFQENYHNSEVVDGYSYDRTDLTFLLGRRIGLRGHIDAGYMLRRERGKWVHRAIQQYAWVNKLRVWRIGHRIRLDQTFSEGRAGVYRLRYRIGGDRPLDGLSMNPGEWYFKWTNEHLPIYSRGKLSYEARLDLMIGHYFADWNKLEVGLDTRLGNIGLGVPEWQFWMLVSWYISL